LAERKVNYAYDSADFVLALVMLVATAVEVRLLAACQNGSAGATSQAAISSSSGARHRAYLYLIGYQWLVVACIIGLWIAAGRAWSVLLLGSVDSLRFAAGLTLAAAHFVFFTRQRRSILNKPALLERVGASFGKSGDILPHTSAERSLWSWAATTAGICEEIMFRGFLLAFATSLIGLGPAVLVTAILFGAYHGNQGRLAAVKAGVAGLVFTLIALALGSLIPGMVIHIVQDIISGDLYYRSVRAQANAAAHIQSSGV
jgi:membrane protease YdiL (CAAX protease family)